MESIWKLLMEMVVLYGIGLVGYIGKRRSTLPKETDIVLTRLVLHITLPALILYSMDFPFSPDMMADMSWLIILSCFAMGAAVLTAKILAQKADLPSSQEGVFRGVIIFGNQGFIGYAVAFLLFGQQGIVYAAIFNLPYLILIWTYGIYIIARREQRITMLPLLFNPGILATVIGLGLFISPFHWPVPFRSLLETLGMPTIPLSMLLIGSLIANLDWERLKTLLMNRYIWVAVAAKLLLIPAMLFPFQLFNLSFTLFAVAVLVTGTPSAPTMSLYAQKYGGDVYFSSVAVCIATILSALTIPALYTIIRIIG